MQWVGQSVKQFVEQLVVQLEQFIIVRLIQLFQRIFEFVGFKQWIVQRQPFFVGQSIFPLGVRFPKRLTINEWLGAKWQRFGWKRWLWRRQRFWQCLWQWFWQRQLRRKRIAK
jgi:hypothetical protein